MSNVVKLLVVLLVSQSCYGYLGYKVINASNESLCGEFVNSAGLDLTFSLEPGEKFHLPIDLDAKTGAGPIPSQRLSVITRRLDITFFDVETGEKTGTISYDEFFPEIDTRFIVTQDGVEVVQSNGQ